MLFPGDLALCERDAELGAGMRIILDSDSLTDRARTVTGCAALHALTPRYVRYKPGTSCLVGFDAHSHNLPNPVPGYARVHTSASRDKIAKSLQHAASPGPLGPGVVVSGPEHLVLFFSPNDHEVPGLALLADHARCERLMRKITPSRSFASAPTFTPLAYKPERRAVFRLDSSNDAPPMVIRLYRPAQSADALQRHEAFAATPTLRLPQVTGCHPRRGIVALTWMEGRPLDQLLRGDRAPEHIAAAARALAQLHGLPATSLASITPDDIALRATAAAAAVADLDPDLSVRVTTLASSIVEKLRSDAGPVGSLHGDCSPKQVIIGPPHAPGLIDFDRAERGPVALDLGTFIAWLEAAEIRAEVPQFSALDLTEAFLSAYAQAAPAPERTTIDHAAALGLLLSAVEPFRVRDPAWPELIRAILARAERFLARSTGTSCMLPPRRAGTHQTLGIPRRLDVLSLDRATQDSLCLSHDTLTLRRAWPRSADHLVLEYSAVSDDPHGSTLVAGQWFRRPSDLHEALRRTTGVTDATAAVVRAPSDEFVLVQSRGTDAKLPALAPFLRQTGAVLISHRPERRAVARLTDQMGTRFVKFLRSADQLEQAWRAGRIAALAAAEPHALFAAPAPLWMDKDRLCLAWSAVPGCSWREAIVRLGPAVSARIGAALAALHALPPDPCLPEHPAEAELRVLGKWAAHAAAFDLANPDDHAEMQRLSAALRSEPVHTPTVIHRDFHDRQVLIHEPIAGQSARIGIIDFDTLSIGDPALDIGNALAHLDFLRDRAEAPRDAIDRHSEAFLAAYSPSVDTARRADLYRAASRLRMKFLHAFRPAADGRFKSGLSASLSATRASAAVPVPLGPACCADQPCPGVTIHAAS